MFFLPANSKKIYGGICGLLNNMLFFSNKTIQIQKNTLMSLWFIVIFSYVVWTLHFFLLKDQMILFCSEEKLHVFHFGIFRIHFRIHQELLLCFHETYYKSLNFFWTQILTFFGKLQQSSSIWFEKLFN